MASTLVVRAGISPLRSAIGRKTAGASTPNRGWCQRTSASTPIKLPPGSSIWGW